MASFSSIKAVFTDDVCMSKSIVDFINMWRIDLVVTICKS